MFTKSLALAAVIALVEAHDIQAFTQQALDAAAAHKEDEKHCRPVIGVGAQPIRSSGMQEYTDAGYTHYIEASYVQALNAVGARVVPLVPDADGSYTAVDEMLSELNGILLTGGSGGNRNFTEHLLDEAVKINDKGKTFPVMGVCLSFQYMGIWKSTEKKLLEKNVAKKVSLPLSFVDNPQDTKQFADLGELTDLLADNAYLWNYHSWGINPIQFFLNDGLRDFWTLTSLMYNDDENQTPFVASMEAKDYPFFGVAFHPERPPTNPKNNWGLNRSEESLHLNEHFFRNFVTYARQHPKSNWYSKIQPELIQNADTIVGDDYWGQVYLF